MSWGGKTSTQNLDSWPLKTEMSQPTQLQRGAGGVGERLPRLFTKCRTVTVTFFSPVVQLKELQESFNREKSSRTDLEMYVAVLGTQNLFCRSTSIKSALSCRMVGDAMSLSTLYKFWIPGIIKLVTPNFLASQKPMKITDPTRPYLIT